jgi:endonuclease/exonuclease/phosphatase family metal-dependent hydrolase
MKKILILGFSFFFFSHSPNYSQPKETLKILSINVWSGTDYTGFFNFGLYEDEERRAQRFDLLVKQIKSINPDVIFIQEANPVSSYSNQLADELGMDNVYIICNAGIKIFGFGPPQNFKEGISILAKKELNLSYHNTWKLAGSFGLYGNLLTLHLDESVFALVTQIIINNTPIYLVNVHLSAEPPYNEKLVKEIEKEKLFENEETEKVVFEEWKKNSTNRIFQIEELLSNISELPENIPVIIGGDFNSTIDSPEMERFFSSNLFFDSFRKSNDKYGFTWFPDSNNNIDFSTRTINASDEKLSGTELISAYYDRVPRRIDYIFYSRNFLEENIINSKVVLDKKENGFLPSDHFGILSEISLNNIVSVAPKYSATFQDVQETNFDAVPILSYDTDAGFGYGGKVFLLNQLGMNESVDVTLFNSTKGERWYRFVFSMPDFELRQGKIYPLAFDLIFDYDKYIKNPFYGVGSESKYDDLEYYTKEPVELGLILSKGFSSSLVAQAGIKFKSTRNFNFETQSKLANSQNPLSSNKAYYTSLYASLLYDTRNSFVNPSSGIVFWNEFEYVNKSFLSNVGFTRLTTWLQYYSIIWYPKTIFAFRAGLQNLFGENLPVQVLSSIGGTRTLRGSSQDRYLDKISSVINAELRFPIMWRIGGIVGVDGGKVWNGFNQIDLKNWSVNSTFGLRFYMDTFVIRLDIGLGNETTGFYFNFGQLF